MKKDVGLIRKIKLKQHAVGHSGDYHVGKHRLTLSRIGNCPETCSVTLNVSTYDEEIQKETIESFPFNFTYIMNPVIINFDHTITGFVLKIWQWLHHPFPDVRL